MEHALEDYPCAIGLSSDRAARAAFDRASSSALADQLIALSGSNTAVERGVAGFLYAWRFGHRAVAQRIKQGAIYFESCPAYLAAIEGVSTWSARMGWAEVAALLQWAEVEARSVPARGGTLRKLEPGTRRGGRHVLLDPWQADALSIAAEAVHPAPGRPRAAPLVLPVPERLGGRRRRTGRTLAIRCPAHEDRRPSFVLWPGGGARCLACGFRAAWRIRGSELHVFASSRPKSLTQKDVLVAISTTKNPPQNSAGPVGGNLAPRALRNRHAISSLGMRQARESRNWYTHRTAGSLAAGDLVEVMQRAERRSLYPSSEQKAQEAAAYFADSLPARAVLRDPLVSVGCVRRNSWRTPWEPSVQRWVLFDFDDIDDLTDDLDDLGDRLVHLAAGDREASGRALAVQTGPDGIQVWLELKVPRHSPEAWFESPDVREWYSKLALGLASEIAPGAHEPIIDMTACSAGRWGRRPGWRIKDGHLIRASLIGVCV